MAIWPVVRNGDRASLMYSPFSLLGEMLPAGGLPGWGWAGLRSRDVMGRTSLGPISAEGPFSNENNKKDPG